MFWKRCAQCHQSTRRRRVRESPTAVSHRLESKQAHHVLILRPFDNGDLVVRLYIRLTDYRARIHCRTMRVNQSRKQSCLPLTALRIERYASSLKLCRTSPNGQPLELWTCLRFSSYERTHSLPFTSLCLKFNPRKEHPRSVG